MPRSGPWNKGLRMPLAVRLLDAVEAGDADEWWMWGLYLLASGST